MSNPLTDEVVARSQLTDDFLFRVVDDPTGAPTERTVSITDAISAGNLAVADAGGYYTGTNVETVLAELPGKFVPQEPSTTADGVHVNTESATYGKWTTFGNAANSMGFAGTGTPAEAYAPLIAYQKYGLSGSPVAKSTQAVAFIARYEAATTDDSAQCGSAFVLLAANTASGSSFTQSKQAVAFEMSAQTSGAVIHDGGAVAPIGSGGARLNVYDTSSVTLGYGFKVAANVDAGALLSTYYGFWQPNAATATAAYGVYVTDPVLSRTGLKVDEAGGDGEFNVDTRTASQSGTSFAYIKGADGQTGVTTMRVQGVTGQTARMSEWWLADGATAAAGVSAAGLVHSISGINIQSSGGVRRAGFNNEGVLIIAAHAAPPDAALNTGDLGMWFDDTATTPKVMVKLKDAAGTVSAANVRTGADNFEIVATFAPGIAGTTAAWGGANESRYARVLEGGSISKVAIHVGTASGNVSVAVYANTGSGSTAAPGARIATSGAVACPAAGYAEVSLGATVTVARGDWLALSCDNATATFFMQSNANSNLFKGLAYRGATEHPLPASPGALTASTSRWPMLVGVA